MDRFRHVLLSPGPLNLVGNDRESWMDRFRHVLLSPGPLNLVGQPSLDPAAARQRENECLGVVPVPTCPHLV